MFNGAHVIICSSDAEADRQFFRDVLQLPNVDAGNGWLIFALPPCEVAFHPHEQAQSHELYLMCEDIQACKTMLTDAGVDSSDVNDEGWGLVSSFQLPGGGTVRFYEPRHARPN